VQHRISSVAVGNVLLYVDSTPRAIACGVVVPQAIAEVEQGITVSDLWSTLVPLAIASAAVPVQLIVTLMLLRSSLRTAAAWVAGMAALRLLQGILLGLVFAGSEAALADSPGGSGAIASALLLVLSVALYTTALRTAFATADPDAPPPRWTERLSSLTPGGAFLAGMAFLAVAVKFWVFTLAAIGAIAEAELDRAAGAVAYLVFVALAQSTHLTLLALGSSSSPRAEAALGGIADWLERNSRALKTVIGVVFGTWFMYKALSGFGVL
jgi:hypothetical protein